MIRPAPSPFHSLDECYSKNLDNLKAACALYFGYYNFCRVHQSLRVLPAVEAGVTDLIWTPAGITFNAGLGADMELTDIFLTFVLPIFGAFIAILVALLPSDKQRREMRERARERRLAEHKMNARLLRLDI